MQLKPLVFNRRPASKRRRRSDRAKLRRLRDEFNRGECP